MQGFKYFASKPILDEMVKAGDVVNVLHQCVDPELGANIVDIGLIYGIKVNDGKDVKLTLTMTSPMCPVTSIIMADAQLRIEAIEGVGKVELELVWDPLWNPEMMSEELRYTS
jgi:metal-sulfur cluster biosynthetic enzyme